MSQIQDLLQICYGMTQMKTQTIGMRTKGAVAKSSAKSNSKSSLRSTIWTLFVEVIR